MFSCYTLIGAQNIAGYGTCPGLGRSKIEAKIELLHETPIKVPSSPLNYLGICQKYQCSAFKRKIKLFFFLLPSLLNFIFFECRDAKRGIKTNLASTLHLPHHPYTGAPADSGLTIQNPTFFHIQPPIIFSFWSSMIVSQNTPFFTLVFFMYHCCMLINTSPGCSCHCLQIEAPS